MPRAASSSDMSPAALQRLVNKKWPGAMRMASDPELEITRVPTGILSLDMLLSGGFARGRHTELFGGFNVGKTYVTFRSIAAVQAEGGLAAFVDAEKTFDPIFAASAGVDLESLAYHTQTSGEQVVDFVEMLLRSNLYDIIVVDSIATLIPMSELEKEMGAGSMGTEQAKMMSKALRKLTAANTKTALVFINQTREAVGVMFGKRSITSGGKAMGFYAGTRLEFTRTENIKRKGKTLDAAKGDFRESDKIVGHRVIARVEKDKTGSAKIADETSFVYDYELGGIDPIEDLIYLGRQYGFIHKNSTSWWVEGYEDEKQASRLRFKRWLSRNIAVAEELEESIRAYDPDTDEDAEGDDDE